MKFLGNFVLFLVLMRLLFEFFFIIDGLSIGLKFSVFLFGRDCVDHFDIGRSFGFEFLSSLKFFVQVPAGYYTNGAKDDAYKKSCFDSPVNGSKRGEKCVQNLPHFWQNENESGEVTHP